MSTTKSCQCLLPREEPFREVWSNSCQPINLQANCLLHSKRICEATLSVRTEDGGLLVSAYRL